MLEAVAMGAIPVQTSTACCDEWFGDSGVAVHEITVPVVKNAIKQGQRRGIEVAQVKPCF
jgi:hypothetical protein